MKTIVLHGDDTVKSYARLGKFVETAKTRGWEIVYDNLPETPSLFGSDRLVVYRDYHLLKEIDIKNITKIDGTLVIYYNSEITSTFLKKMPKDFKMEKYELPKILFNFLENIYPGNLKRCLSMLNQIVENQPVELVFFFIAKQLRDMAWVLIDPKVTGFADWKTRKLMYQAGKFKKGQLEKMIEGLCDIDVKVKTSKANLKVELDLLLIRELE